MHLRTMLLAVAGVMATVIVKRSQGGANAGASFSNPMYEQQAMQASGASATANGGSVYVPSLSYHALSYRGARRQRAQCARHTSK